MNGASHGHLGDLLSALADGELAADEARDAGAHLAVCEACRAELAATSAMRSLVRGLPAVEPPFGTVERIVLRARRAAAGARARRGWRRGVAAVAAGAAAAVALLVLATPSAEPVGPSVGDLVARHATSASAAGDPVIELVPVAVSVAVDP